MSSFDVIIVGGGAAGFYGAIHIAEADRGLKVAILEKGRQVLTKVKVSGGGRCNVTHAQFEPLALSKNYPRGEKELLGPFHTHSSEDTVAFFEERGIPLKTEQDGRMFPNTDSSRTIVDFLLKEARRLGIALLRNTAVVDIAPIEKDKTDGQGGWKVVSDKKSYRAKKILLSTGGNPKIWRLLARLGHAIVDPVPSLFTFNIDDPRIRGIQGVSTNALVEVLWKKTMAKEITVPLRSQQEKSSTLVAEGPLLITHWGMSGPAILKLSAWGAKVLNEYQYKFTIRVNWLPDYQKEGLLSELMQIKEVEARKTILRTQALEIPRRLWINLVTAAGITRETKWASVTRKQLDNLASQLTQSVFPVHGKSTFKEEFVTAGGVDLKEINFKTFESKIHPNLYFAGEIIDVDAITGGFNFQNAWTGAYIAARAIAGKRQ